MKKHSPTYKQWNNSEQKRIRKKEIKAKQIVKQEKIRQKRRRLRSCLNLDAGGQLLQTARFKIVVAPEVFGLVDDKSRKELLLFIKKVKSNLSKGYNVDICFSETSNLLPCGTLWATAKIESLIDLYPEKLTCNYPDDNIVEQLFQHIGLLNKLGLKKSRVDIDSDIVRHWHYVAGTTTDNVSLFAQLFDSIKLPGDLSAGLFESMSEAVTNTVQHAYNKEQPKEWRMFAQHKEDKLDVVICDLGIGIPNSLKQKPELKAWLTSPIQTRKRNSDTALLEIAIQSSQSKTKLPHRGKGLKDMLEMVKNGKVGGFRIFSGKGGFNYSASEKNETTKRFESPIKGTLIEWQISLEKNNDT